MSFMSDLINPLTGVIAVGVSIWALKSFVINRSEEALDEIEKNYFERVVLPFKESKDIRKLKDVLDNYYEFKETRRSINAQSSLVWILLVASITSKTLETVFVSFQSFLSTIFYPLFAGFLIILFMLWNNCRDLSESVTNLKDETESAVHQK